MSLSVPVSKYQYDAPTVFTWTITNFELCPYGWGKPLKSPPFSINSWKLPTFHLLLYAKGINQKQSDHISLYLVKNNDNSDNRNDSYSCELGILTSQGKTTLLRFNSALTHGNGRGMATFINREKLLSSERHLMLPDGNLTLFCEISVAKLSSTMNDKIRSKLTDFSNIFAKLYENDRYCDVALQTPGKTFKCHKAILEARFPDLAKGENNDLCEIKNIKASTVDALLQYVYSGILKVSEVNLFELLISGYKIPSHLKSLLLRQTYKIQTTTCFEQKVMSFKWTIQNFSTLNSDKVLRYTLIDDSNRSWTWLSIFLTTSTNDTNEDNVAITIERYSTDCHRIICTITVSDVTETFDHTFEKEHSWTLPDFITKNELIKKQSGASTSDEVNFDFKISMSDGSKRDEIQEVEFFSCIDSVNQLADDLKSFQKDFKNLFLNPKFSDVTLIASEDKFPAHKFILNARSSVFSHMLQNETTDSKSSEIAIEDLNSEVVEDMLLYIYCDEIELSLSEIKHVLGLYNAANKYNLIGLREKCSKLLKLRLNAETAGEILISADKWNDEDLKVQVYYFVCLYPEQIAKSKDWEEIMLRRNDLAVQVLNRTLSHLASSKK